MANEVGGRFPEICGAIMPGEYPYSCTLDTGHAGNHVAQGSFDPEQTWAEPESVDVAPQVDRYDESDPRGLELANQVKLSEPSPSTGAQEAAEKIVALLEKRIDDIQEGEPAIDLLRVSEVEQIIRKAKP